MTSFNSRLLLIAPPPPLTEPRTPGLLITCSFLSTSFQVNLIRLDLGISRRLSLPPALERIGELCIVIRRDGGFVFCRCVRRNNFMGRVDKRRISACFDFRVTRGLFRAGTNCAARLWTKISESPTYGGSSHRLAPATFCHGRFRMLPTPRFSSWLVSGSNPSQVRCPAGSTGR